MNNIRNYLVILALLTSYSTHAQLSKKDIRQNKKELRIQEVKQLIENKSFNFKAHSLTTHTGFHKLLNSEYDFIVKNDSITSYLPFWGTAHFPCINDDGGLKFKERSTGYQLRNKGKKGYDISLNTRANGDNYLIVLLISREGYANLTISSTKRSVISFDGKIEAIQTKSCKAVLRCK